MCALGFYTNLNAEIRRTDLFSFECNLVRYCFYAIY